MSNSLILFPVIVQILLTLSLYILLSVRKSRAVKRGDVDESRRGLFDDAWPVDVMVVNNCIRNQFEVPVLFYVLASVLFALQAVDYVSLLVAWLFVASRVAHAWVHTGSNYVPLRRRIFMFGTLLVLVMSVLASRAIFSVI